MSVQWSVDDVDRMAPDASSVAAGRKLAQPKLWSNLGSSPTHLWGELQGSGSKPYQTSIELAEPAFHCSCPSRKIPCKHVLGLAYLFAASPEVLPAATPLAWVAEWISKRSEREERKQAKAQSAAQPADEATEARRAKAQEKRAQARFDKAADGIQFISQWLHDALRYGVASVADHPYRYWDELAARTVDAQIPGLARHFRRLAALRHGRTEWQGPFLDTLAHLALLCWSFERYQQLEEPWRADIEAALGFSLSREELLAQPGISDHWWLLGTWAGEEEGLRFQRSWLYGLQSGRSAMVLEFAARGQVLPIHAPLGHCFDGELVFYPSGWPQRALVKQRGEPQPGSGALPGAVAGLAAVQEQFAAAMERLPWVERIAVTLTAVTPSLTEAGWFIVDAAGAALPLSSECRSGWELLSLSGGAPLDLVCEFDGETLLPLTIADSDGVRPVPGGNGRIEAPNPAPLYSPWQQLTTLALLGAERQQQVLRATGELGALLVKLYPEGALSAESDARSHTLLQAVTLLSHYRRAAQPPRHDINRLEPSPADVESQSSALAAAHLHQLIEEGDTPLVREWLELAAANHKRAPHHLLPALLDLAAGNRALSLTTALIPVVGARGRWLAAQQESWRKALASLPTFTADEALRQWEEGSDVARNRALAWLRREDPAAARERLAAVIAKESAEVRALLLWSLRDNLEMADVEFLQSQLGDKSQEVRQRAAQLLSLLPESPLAQQLRQRGSRWLAFREKSGLLSRLGGRKGELLVTLPEAWEAALRSEGIIEKAPRGKGAKGWWFEQLLALVAPHYWCEQWQLSPTECLALSDGHEWGESMRSGWVEATLLHQDEAWAESLLRGALQFKLAALLQPQLWRILTPASRERVLAQLVASGEVQAIAHAIEAQQQWQEEWSAPLSRQVIDGLRLLLDSSRNTLDYRAQALLRGAATQLARSELDYFETRFARELAEETPWKRSVEETRARLGFRTAMGAALCA